MANYWLMKSELDVYNFDDLVADGSTHWDGVRNYQARNFMRDKMKLGDYVFYYHSNTKPPHIAGIAKVCKESYPDHSQFDVNSKYFDEKATAENPRWFMVDIEPVVKFSELIGLPEVKSHPELEDMPLVQKGQRLSIQPVSEHEFGFIMALRGLDITELE